MDQVLTGGHANVRWGEEYRLAAALGFEGVELGVGANWWETRLWDAASRRELLGLAHECGVVTASLCLHGLWAQSPASEDGAVRVEAERLVCEACAVAAELGAEHLLLPLTCPDGVAAEPARERWVEGLCRCATVAQGCGVVLCVENVGRAFANEHADIAALVDAVGSQAVQAYYDPGNAVFYGVEPLAGVKVLGRRIAQVHVKEMGAALLGDGVVPWPALLAALKGVGFHGWFVLETEPTAEPLEAARRNLETLMRWVRTLA